MYRLLHYFSPSSPLSLSKSIKQSRGRMTRQSYENIIHPTQHVIFLRSESIKVCSRQTPLLRTGDSVWPVSTSFLVNTVFSVSAVPFRHHSLAKRNGARRRHQTRSRTRKGTQQKSPVGWAETGDRI